MKSRKKIKSSSIRNFFGILMILTSVSPFSDGLFIPTILFILFGLSLTTYVDSFMANNKIDKTWKRVILCSALFFLLGLSLPQDENYTAVSVKSTQTIAENTIHTIPTTTSSPISTESTEPTISTETTQTTTSLPESTEKPINTKDNQKNNVVETIAIDACDLSGNRRANAIVDIGYGDREYYAYTNEYGQLVKVTASQIIIQNKDEENSNGRYCADEAKVPGVEDPNLDEGHIIADSLGGVSNAYNITPMNSQLNRYGSQADMEDEIRDAGGATNFEAIITYPDTDTMIPSHYKYTYTINGFTTTIEFDNSDEEATSSNSNKSEVNNNTNTSSNSSNNSQQVLSTPSKSQEQIDCENNWGTWRDGSWCDWGTTSDQVSEMVWISATGSKYHSIPNCGRMNPDKASQISLSDAEERGLGRCSKCW